MKQILLLLLVLSAATTAFAQVPQSFNYQAVARDADGKPISKGLVTVTANILRNGTEVYSEKTDHTTTTTGLFTLRVGEGDPTDFQAIDWSLGGYSLQVKVGGAIIIETAAVPIVSVPYALMADEVVNERQQLIVNGNQLTITGAGGNTVTLAATSNTYQAGAGIEVTNNTITNKGDVDPTDDLTKTTDLDGDVTGKYDKLQIKPGVVGSDELANGAVTGTKIAQQGATNGQVLKWNGTTWVPDTDLTTVGSGNTATSAPLTGNGSAGSPVSLTPGTISGQVLKWNGTAWAPATDETSTGGSNTYAAGPGISVTGSSPNLTINNTGDINASDDLTNATNFGGDVSGTYNNLQIGANAVGATELANGAVTGAKIAQQGATNGQVLKWNGTTWAPQDDIGGGTGDGWGSQTASTGTALTGNGTPASPLNLAQQGASNGQVLKWNATNSTWIPAQDLSASTLEDLLDVTTTGVNNGQVLQWNGTQWVPASPKTYSAGTGITIDAQNQIINTAPDVPLSLVGSGATTVTGTYPNLTVTTPAAATYSAGPGITVTGSSPNFTINNTGDTNAADDLTNATNFGGDVSGAYNNLQISANAVGTNEIANGSITAADLAAGVIPTTLPPNGAAGNDLSGLYPNPTVARIQGQAVAPIVPTDGQVLRYSAANSRWEPATSATAGGWNLTGNSGTNPSTNFIGTKDAQPISFRVNDTLRMKLWGDGRLELFGNDGTNTFVGQGAGQSNTTGGWNTANGGNALGSNTTGIDNTANGYLALGSNTTGRNNTANGAYALGSNTTGGDNMANGSGALLLNTTGNSNIANGNDALYYNITGDRNTATGHQALYSNRTGNSNIAIGTSALYSNTTSSNLVAVGDSALYSNTSGMRNTALGSKTLFQNTSGHSNTASGSSALGNNTTGNYNTAIGEASLGQNTTGSENTATGDNALFQNKTGRFNTANGAGTLSLNTTGNSNVAIGAHALYSNTTTSNLVAVGDSALYSNTSGFGNTAVGSKAGLATTEGGFNSFFGRGAGRQNISGEENSFFGFGAGEATNGSQNTFVGMWAGRTTAGGGQNVCIGNFAGTSSGNSNTVAIGFTTNTTASNTIALGNTSITSIKGQVGFTTYSDARIKTAIQENVPGLAFIQKLRPVTYHYDTRRQNALLGITDTAQWEGKYDIEKMTFSGFLAQEVEQAARSIGYDFSGVDAPKNDKSLYGLRYAEFTVPLVKAVQEQQAMIESQKAELGTLQSQLATLQLQVQALVSEVKAGKTSTHIER